ncbi:MAG: hypothetical protein ACLR0U_09360 [Enterocloster clostridioformis]
MTVKSSHGQCSTATPAGGKADEIRRLLRFLSAVKAIPSIELSY